MVNLLKVLSERKLLNLLIGTIFYILVTLPHEFVGVTIAELFKGVSRSKYDLTILLLGITILCGFIFTFWIQLRKLIRPAIPLGFFIFCLIAMIISLNMLIIINIEIIHFIQYGVLACIIFPLFRSFFPTLLAIVILGAIDEGYQYYFLSPDRTNYYDFNDVILNQLGGAMGLIYLRAHRGIKSMLRIDLQTVRHRAWSLYITMVCISTLIIIRKDFLQKLIDGLGFQLDWSGYGAVLIRKPTTGFWTEIPPKIIYHVVQPVEGMIIITILLFIFSYLYKQTE